MLIYRYKWAFVGDAAAGCMDNNNLSSDFVPHITRIAKLMDNKVNFLDFVTLFCNIVNYSVHFNTINYTFRVAKKKSNLTKLIDRIMQIL